MIKKYQESVFEVLEQQIGRGFEPRWFVTYHYKQPSDDLVPEREKNSNRWGYRDSDRGCSDSELNFNQWNRSGAYTAKERIKNSREQVEMNTIEMRNRLLKMFYGVSKLDQYQKKKYNVKPMLFFHEQGRSKVKYHTHLVLGDTRLNLNTESHIQAIFNSELPRYGMKGNIKCLAINKSIKVEHIYDQEGLFDYLNKETTPEEMSLDITGSLMYTRRKEGGHRLLHDSIGYEVTSVGTGKQDRRLINKDKKRKKSQKKECSQLWLDQFLGDEEIQTRKRVERQLNDVLNIQTKTKKYYEEKAESMRDKWTGKLTRPKS